MKVFQFNGSGFEYFKIWIVNILLTIITLGIYYPWAKVRNNRYLYANSALEDKNFEYHATGKQLFFGYLIGFSLFIAYNILGQIFPTLSLVFLFVFFVAIPWIIWQSMRFNLNVTSFNNIHFRFNGELKISYVIFLLIPFLFMIALAGVVFLISLFKDSSLLITLSILLVIVFYIISAAYFITVKSRYLINNSSYGGSDFDIAIDTPAFIKIILKTILISILTLIISFALIAGVISFVIGFDNIINFISLQKSNPEIAKQTIQSLPFVFIFIISYVVMIAGSSIPFAYYITKQREYIFEKTVLDENINFESTMKFLKYAYILLTNFLMILFTLGLAYPWAKVRVLKYALDNTTIHLNELESKEFFNQIEKKTSALGEQIGDSFDVDVGLSI